MREVFQGLEKAVYENGPDVILVKVGSYQDGLKDAFDQSVAQGLTRSDKAGKLKLWPVTDPLSDVLPPPAAAAPKAATPAP